MSGKIKIVILLFVASFFLFAFALADEAVNLAQECKITGPNLNRTIIKRLLDEDYKTTARLPVNKVFTIDSPEAISGVFLQFLDLTTAVDIQVQDGEDWYTVKTIGHHLTDWVDLPEGITSIRLLNTGKKEAKISKLEVYGMGDRPLLKPDWQDLDKADIMLLVGHPDDELMWFGGFLPTYAGDRDLKVLVVYLAPTRAGRKEEALNGLWTCGVKYYPVFLNFTDKKKMSLEGQYGLWGKEKVWSTITSLIRQYQPDVVLTQSFDGEYGHGAHQVAADALTRCIFFAADESAYPASAEQFGTWSVQKAYLHLYDDDQMIHMDWNQPLEAFDGETSLSVATRALNFHVSQLRTGRWSMAKGELYDNTLFGLYYSAIGPDEACDDFMEHVILSH